MRVLAALALVAACQPAADPDTAADTDTDVVDDGGPGAAFDRFCLGRDWRSTLAATTVGDLGDTNRLPGTYDLAAGTVYGMKLVPDQPVWVKTVRVMVQKGNGPVRIRLTPSWGRSQPDVDNVVGPDLMPPIETTVDASAAPTWLELDVADQGVFLLPTQHVHLALVQQEGGPTIVRQKVPEGQVSRALILVPGEDTPYGDSANFRMELVGESFCPWSDDDRWFGRTDQPFSTFAASRPQVIDLDGDGHDDVVVNGGDPRLFRGDGRGGFTEVADPWPEAAGANVMVFADVDNDGDRDAFAAFYTGADDDGDRVKKVDGDCDDTDPNVAPGKPEVAGNGMDDDCDGTADDGTDTTDADGDGASIADGDCDDTDPARHPGAVEAHDGRDDDCDGLTDEDFVHRILLNDGAGAFVELPDSGVEGLEPTTAAAFADADRDGLLDLYWGNWLVHYPDDPAVQDRYVVGLGEGRFADALEAAGLKLTKPLSPYGVTWTDQDDDGWPDLYVSNYHLYANQLWRNDRDGTFTDVAKAVGAAFDDIPSGFAQYPGGHSYGADFADFDNDGDIDAFVSNLSHPRTQPWADPSMLLVNQGAPDFVFTNEREERGILYDEGDINAMWGDYDNDGDLDLAIASLYPSHTSKLFRNDGDRFTDVSFEAGTIGHVAGAVVWADVDEDGDLDLVQAAGETEGRVELFENRVGQDNGWVELDLVGTTSNRDAIGARVWVTAGGVTRIRDIHGGQGLSNSQPPHRVHVGLGDATTIDAVEVRWPSGVTESFTVAPRGIRRLVEGEGS